ncbi:hypothetical protein ACEUZ9_004695 [Paracoccus litorisediminis]|uniref:secretion/conjugation apparatus DotM-related subunit n=1 Tax=Paracoccus litorisediminis TaxID=2006130 RepID=UPI00372F5EC1
MSQNNQQSQGDDQEFLKLLIFAIIAIIGLMAFFSAQEQRFNAFMGALSWLHVAPFAYAAYFMPVLMDIPLIGKWLFIPAAGAEGYLTDGGYAMMNAEARTFILVASGRCASLIYGVFLAWIAFRGQDFRVDQKYRTRHSLESMIWVQSEMWLSSRLARYVNPLKGKEITARRLAEAAAKKVVSVTAASEAMPRGHLSISPGTWNRALRPEEWLVASGLTFNPSRYAELGSGEGIVRERDYEFREQWLSLNLESLSEVLSEQLRQPWLGPEKLRPSHRAAYAIMAMFYDYDIDGGNRLVNDIGALSDVTKGKRYALDAALLGERGMMARIDKTCTGSAGRKLGLLAKNSAWVESAFPVMLAAARKDRGVLPPAAFLWMKSQDRLMWYIMNNVGNEAVCIEAAGALAHARAEQQIGRKMRRPAVYQASRALLEDYLDMTPERINARAIKEVRGRSPGVQLGLIRDSILKSAKNGEIEA